MADDNIKSTVIRTGKISFVKDNIQYIIHYETDADCVKNLNTAIVNGVSNVFNNDESIRDIIANIALGGVDLSTFAKLDSPSFTGEPKTPTPDTSDNSTKLANTEFVNNKITELKTTTASKTDLNNYVSKANDGTISGLKTFNNNINISSTYNLYWKNGDTTVATLNKNSYSGTSDKAIKDQKGNIIDTTYATKTELSNKQNLLTFDKTPTENSSNPVTSGGVYTAIEDITTTGISNLATVAKTGSYSDLINKPTIGTDDTSGLTKLYNTTGSNEDGSITQKNLTSLLANKADSSSLAAIAKTGNWSDLSSIPTASDTKQGVVNLYDILGDHTKGTISQYGIKTILNDYAKKTDISSIYDYKGSVDNYSNLPTTNNKVGDVYNIKNADTTHNIKAGDNIAWNGTEWDNLSGVVDLSAYSTTEQANKLYLGIKGNAVSATSANQATYIDFTNYSTDDKNERYIPFCHSGDAVAGTSPSRTRVVYSTGFTYTPSTDTLKVGNINSSNIVKAIDMAGNKITITKGDNTTKDLTIDSYTKSEIDTSITTKNLTVTTALNIPGGKIWIE